MNDKLFFVQFLHPGGEHEPDRGLIKSWNTKDHKRKFLKGPGAHLADRKLQKGEIVFWGEWEPESKVQRKIDNPIAQGPRFMYEPYYVAPKSFDKLQNTDPFVFGEVFHYTGCQQRTTKGPTQLRHLSRGSVILFGSCKNSAFVLDTVFVVDRWIDHSPKNYRRVLAGAISQEYRETTILPWYQAENRSCVSAVPFTESKSCGPAGPAETTWRLYYGVHHSNPLQDMYSFFPCQPYEPESKGFARPRIRLAEITDNKNEGWKQTEQPNLDKMAVLWRKVAEQVRDRNLALGVYAEMPVHARTTVSCPPDRH
jgi:hypothetical protein